MPFYSIGTLGLLLGPSGFYSADLSGAPSPPPEGLSPSWLVEYVDTSGVRQRTTVASDGSTSITINQYANLTFDGRATRSTSTGCDTAAGAAQLMGYGINYGEALGGTWSTSGLSNDTDIGPPIFSRCYTVTGARTVTLYVRDPDAREHALTLTVNVQTLGSVVDISSGGSWPTWASNTVYGLSSGDYTSRGTISMDGLYGVRLVKIGGGANPVVGSFQPDSRGLSHGSVITYRSKDCVLVNVDYSTYAVGLIGADYCGSYGGNCAGYGEGTNQPIGFYWDLAISSANPTNAANIKRSRGEFIVNGGTIGATAALPQYCLIGGGRSMNFAGTTFARTTGTNGGNPMRPYMDSTVLRHMQVYSTSETYTNIKGSLRPNIYAATPSDAYPDDDSIGDYTTSRALYVANGAGGAGGWGTGGSYFWINDNLFGGPGASEASFTVASIAPQNADVPTNGLTGPWFNENCYESGYTSGIENNRLTYNTDRNFALGGKDMSARGNTQLSGAACGTSTDNNNARIHPDYRGPYITSTRPVHSALA